MQPKLGFIKLFLTTSVHFDYFVVLVWRIGLSPNDNYLMQATVLPSGSLLEVKDGYLWTDGVNTGTMLGTIDTVADVNQYEIPGYLWMEPGICISNDIQAVNLAYTKTNIPTLPLCIKSMIKICL